MAVGGGGLQHLLQAALQGWPSAPLLRACLRQLSAHGASVSGPLSRCCLGADDTYMALDVHPVARRTRQPCLSVCPKNPKNNVTAIRACTTWAHPGKHSLGGSLSALQLSLIHQQVLGLRACIALKDQISHTVFLVGTVEAAAVAAATHAERPHFI